MLEQEQLLYHVRKAKQGEENSKSILFSENAPLIKSLVNRFKNKGVEQEDLYQIACIGFLKAINNFDENFGVKFSTYSVPMVIGEIKRYMRDNGAIKVSRTLKILANKINRYVDEFVSNKGVSPTVEHLSNVFSVPEEEVVIAIDSSKMPLSIYEKYEDEEDGQELIDKIFDG
ncbi:MAG: sigma-70 family RNA polymerase sigma factor, partial [Clostridia bacterium]|nr:sigma-70 family RNA polymerase sigma factor [Clostridia bacterium]